MLFLGIYQHRKQLTVSIRNEAGDVVLSSPTRLCTLFDNATHHLSGARRNMYMPSRTGLVLPHIHSTR